MKKQMTPLTEIEGIGKNTFEELVKSKCYFAEDFIAEPFETLITKISKVNGINANNLYGKYIPCAKLLRIEGMNGQIAEGLVASGITSYRDMVFFTTDAIEKAMIKRKEEGLIQKAPSQMEIIKLQLQAGRLVESGFLHLTIFDGEDGKRLKKATVKLVRCTRGTYNTATYTTNKAGILAIDGLCYGSYTIQIRCAGYKNKSFPITFSASNHAQKIRIPIMKGSRKPIIVNEFDGVVLDPVGCEIKEDKVQLADLPSLPPASVLSISSDKVTLLSLMRKKVDNVVYFFTYDMDVANLPKQTKEQDVLLPNDNGDYQLSDLSVAQFRVNRKKEIGRKKHEEWKNKITR